MRLRPTNDTDWDESEHPRAEDGKFGSGPGGGGGASKERVAKAKATKAANTAARESKIKALGLNANERKMMELALKRASDKKIMATLGMGRNEALKVAFGLRQKLGVKPGETTREAANRHLTSTQADQDRQAGRGQTIAEAIAEARVRREAGRGQRRQGPRVSGHPASQVHNRPRRCRVAERSPRNRPL